MTRLCTALLLASLLPIVGGCIEDDAGIFQTQVSGQIVGEDGNSLGPGLVLIERGPVHGGAYETGGLIDDKGRFTIELNGGGTYGLHLFHSEYQYLPLEITVAEHQQVLLTSMMVSWGVWMDLSGQPTWPDQPSDATLIRMPFDEDKKDNPVIEDITVAWSADDMVAISVKVSDPDKDLSRMVLCYDPATTSGFALLPPKGKSADKNGNYPEGTYTFEIFIDERHVPGVSKLHFVVSDNMCNNPPILTRTIPKP